MRTLTIFLLGLFLALPAQAQNIKVDRLPLPTKTETFLEQIKTLKTLQERLEFYNQWVSQDALLNCTENQIDFWRLRRCCTDHAAYAWQDTVVVIVTDRITNWNTWPWNFEGTIKAILAPADTVPHTVNLLLVNASGDTLLNWEEEIPLELIPGDWSFTVWFLWWVETTRILELINFPSSTYTLVAELRATGYWGTSIEVEFTIDYPVPVELTSFTAKVDGNTVWLAWTTATEINVYGFAIERQAMSGAYKKIGFVQGYGNSNLPKHYIFHDKVLPGQYLYRLKQIDLDGASEYYGPVEVVVGPPLAFNLYQNYPNPFNPTTTIEYAIPQASEVRLTVYNVLGQEVEVLVNQYQPVGFYQVDFNGSSLSGGIYFYHIQAGSYSSNKKMVLLK